MKNRMKHSGAYALKRRHHQVKHLSFEVSFLCEAVKQMTSIQNYLGKSFDTSARTVLPFPGKNEAEKRKYILVGR
jgi:hypothetical protein